MTHAKSLRLIGQSLETAKLQAFELKTEGQNYIAHSDSLTAASEWILRYAVSPHGVSEQSVRQACSSHQLIFHALTNRQRDTGELTPLHIHRRIIGLLNFYSP